MSTGQTSDTRPGQEHVTWRKSRRSTAEHACVEVASVAGGIGVRDSKDPQGQTLAFEPGEWTTFLTRIKRHQLDGRRPS